MKWYVKCMYGMFVAVGPADCTIWAKTQRELNELFKNAGYSLNEG